VLKAIEIQREAGAVGSSLQATVEIRAGQAIGGLLNTLGEGLKFVMITSEAQVVIDPQLAADAVSVRVSALPHPKCGRCWHLRPEVGQDPAHPQLCSRCVSNLFGEGERRAIA
jgi:isoleucyl-tRNA synthetase